MARYLVKRILLIIPTMLFIALVVFLLMYNLPGSNINEFRLYGDGDYLDSVYQRFEVKDSAASRFIRYCYDLIVNHRMGPSDRGNVDISADLWQRLKSTLMLTGLGMAASVIIGIPLGVWAAVYHNRWQDRAVTLMTLLLSSIPSYCLTVCLVLIFSLWLGLLPTFGVDGGVSSYILPTITISAGGIAALTRMTRFAMLETLDQQYITALRSKGLKERAVICLHALKNSMVTIVSSLNNVAAQILCGTLIVENFFGIRGLGSYLVDAVFSRNQHQVLGCVLILALLLVTFNLIADMLHAAVNPKIRIMYSKKGKKGVASKWLQNLKRT